MHIHASCAARDGAAVLLTGPPGSGKSDLVLRLLDQRFILVADDQVAIVDGIARPPEPLEGLLEVRGLGLIRVDFLPAAPLKLVVRLATPSRAARLPVPEADRALSLPVIDIDPWQVSAAQRVALALDCLTGAAHQIAGALVA